MSGTIDQSIDDFVSYFRKRFGEIGTHEIFAVISKDNIVKWFVSSSDFPKWELKVNINAATPKETAAGDYFNKGIQSTEIKSLSSEEWFVPPTEDNRADRRMYEQCIFLGYGTVVSLLWFD